MIHKSILINGLIFCSDSESYLRALQSTHEFFSHISGLAVRTAPVGVVGIRSLHDRVSRHSESGILRLAIEPSRFAVTDGYIGEIAELLMRAAVKAIETKKERIDCRLLADLNWKPPLQRRGEARGLHKTLAGSSPTT